MNAGQRVIGAAGSKDIEYVKALGSQRVVNHQEGQLENAVPPVDLALDTVGGETRETIPMKAIVVTDQAAGTAGMTLVEWPEPQAAINDVVVQVHASGFTSGELTWPSTWTDRLDRDRTRNRSR